MNHANENRKRVLTKREPEVKGYGIKTCFGAGGCPNRACHMEELPEMMEKVLEGKNLKGFLQRKVKGPLKMHHEFRVSVSDCPNGCSRPQITDFGLLGAERPEVSKEACNACGACEAICREKAVLLEGETIRIDESRCLVCGQCIGVCPSGTLVVAEKGYRILLGGKLGRHPRLAEALPSIHSSSQVLETLAQCLDHYLRFSIGGERFGEVLEREPFSYKPDGPERKSECAVKENRNMEQL